MTITIRSAVLSDFDQWKPLWISYNEFYGRVGPTALLENITKTTWNRFFDPAESVHCIIAEYQGRVVGLAHSVFHRNTLMLESTCYLQDLYSKPSMRGKGVGRALIDAVYKHANKAGIKSVYWHTHLNNETAMNLYDKVATNTKFVVYRKNF